LAAAPAPALCGDAFSRSPQRSGSRVIGAFAGGHR
jgi:hypothetical protein